jgi:hypothetical protein
MIIVVLFMLAIAMWTWADIIEQRNKEDGNY